MGLTPLATPRLSATASSAVILIGCAITVPAIAGCTSWSYRVLWGKARELTYA